MRTSLLLLFLTLATSVSGQNEILKKKVHLRGQNLDALSIHNASRLKLFLTDKDSIRAISVNPGDEVDEIKTARSTSKFSDIIGYSHHNENYNLFFTNSAHSGLAAITFDFTSGKSTEHMSDLKMRGERFMAAASYKNRFYVLNVVKNTSTIKLYIFDEPDKFEVKTFSFDGRKFGAAPKTTIDAAISENPVVYVDNTVPNPLEITTNRNKLYTNDDKLILTFDSFVQYTVVITIDLKGFTERLDFYTHSPIECKDGASFEANSYIFNRQLYQFKLCSSAMVFAAVDMSTKETVKRYFIDREDDLTIANTPIRQEGSKSPYGPAERNLSKTKQFLRKVSHSRAGVAVTEGPNGLQITLGAAEQFNATMGAPGGGSFASAPMTIQTPQGPVNMPAYQTYTNPATFGFNNYIGTFSVYVKCLFDPKNLEHREGEISDNVFDVISKYIDNLKPSSGEGSSILAKTIVKQQQGYVLGYYDQKARQYVLVSFD